MTRVDIRAALDMLPRFFERKRGQRDGKWDVEGDLIMTNNQIVPPTVDAAIKRIMPKMINCDKYKPRVESIDVCKESVYVIHRSLSVKSLHWLLKRNFEWQKWPAGSKYNRKLPVLVRSYGKYLVWNGTHRMTLCRIAEKRLRCVVYDVAEYGRATRGNR